MVEAVVLSLVAAAVVSVVFKVATRRRIDAEEVRRKQLRALARDMFPNKKPADAMLATGKVFYKQMVRLRNEGDNHIDVPMRDYLLCLDEAQDILATEVGAESAHWKKSQRRPHGEAHD